jgi:hypothetical protein
MFQANQSDRRNTWPERLLGSRAGWVVVLVMAIVIWAAAANWLVRREITIGVSGLEGTSAWALEWEREKTHEWHGRWLDLEQQTDAILEVEPSGRGPTSDGAFEFWLYSVKPDNGPALDLKNAILPSAESASAGWIPFEQGPGVIYVGKTRGSLRLPIRGRSAIISYAKTDRGGDVVLRFRGETIILNTNAPSTAGATAVIPSAPPVPHATVFREQLPVYAVSDVRMRWLAPANSAISVESTTLCLRFFGCTLAERAVKIEPSRDVAQSGTDRWTVNGSEPTMQLRAELGLGVLMHIIGLFSTLIAVVVAVTALRPIFLAVRAVCLAPSTLTWSVIGLVLIVNLTIGWKTPTFVTPDGLDYIDGADELASHGTFARFAPYKAPGLNVLLAGAMLIGGDFLRNFGLIQTLLSIVTAFLAYGLLRFRVGHPWALLGGFLVGVHPTLLTYQCYLLREIPAATLVIAIAFSILLVTERLQRGKDAWIMTMLLGVLCAAASYTRENLQPLVLLVPIILLVCPRETPIRRRAAGSLVVLLLSLALVAPRAIQMYREYGAIGVVSPKTQANRALAVWTNGLSDGDDTRFFGDAEWRELRDASAAPGVSEYEFVRRLLTSSGAVRMLGGAPRNSEGPIDPREREAITGSFVSETFSRNPVRAARASLLAFVSQLGLWTIRDGTGGSSNEWYSRPLRGEPSQFSTNYTFDVQSILSNERLRDQQDRLRPLIERTRRGTEHLAANLWLRLFNEWFWAFQAFRPVLAALFLIGCYAAARRRDFALFGVGAIVLFSILSAAIVVATQTDRFAVPFLPILICMAIYAIATWREKPSMAGSGPE